METEFVIREVRVRNHREEMGTARTWSGMKEAQRKADRKSRVYFFVEGENVWENLMNRFDRPHKFYRTLLPEVFAELGIAPTKVRWSQKAGCGCGCSPGFILDGVTGTSIFVTLEEVEVERVEHLLSPAGPIG